MSFDLIPQTKRENDVTSKISLYQPSLLANNIEISSQNFNKKSSQLNHLAINQNNNEEIVMAELASVDQICSENIPAISQEVEQEKEQQSPLIHKKLKGFFLKIKIKNWVKKIVNRTRSRMYQNLTILQLQMINDKSYDASSDINRKQIQFTNSLLKFQNKTHNSHNKEYFLDVLEKLDQYLPVLAPKNILTSLFDFFSVLSTLFIFFALSISVSFQYTIDQITPLKSIYFCLGILILNIFLKLNTSYTKLGANIRERKLIFMYYAKNNLFVDFMSIFSIILLVIIDNQIQMNSYSDLTASTKVCVFSPFILKLKSISARIQKFEDKIFLKQRQQYIIQLVRLFSLIIFINHLLACLWIFNSKLTSNRVTNWFEPFKDLSDSGWVRTYILSFYFCTVTMTTVGYGDITAKNLSEYVIVICIVMTSSGVFGFTLNQIGNIFSEFSAEEKELKKKLNIINLHMEKKKINHSLQNEIREYLQYVWKENNEKFQNDCQGIVEQLNENLKNELYLHQNKQIISYLREFFSEQFIEKVILFIQVNQVKPQQIIQTEGQIDDICLYLIEKGNVEFIIEDKNPVANASRCITILEEGSLFGISEFFLGERVANSKKALGFVNLLKISRQDFIKTLKDFPLDAEKFHYLKDKLIQSGEGGKIGEKCKSCQDKNHLCSVCPYLHLIIDKKDLITKISYKSYEIQSERKKTIRTNLKIPRIIFTNTIKEDHYFDRYQEFIINYGEEIEDYESEYLCYDFQHKYIGINQKDSEEEEEGVDQNNQKQDNFTIIHQKQDNVAISNQKQEEVFIDFFRQKTTTSPSIMDNLLNLNELQQKEMTSIVISNDLSHQIEKSGSSKLIQISSPVQYELLPTKQNSNVERRKNHLPSLIRNQRRSSQRINSFKILSGSNSFKKRTTERKITLDNQDPQISQNAIDKQISHVQNEQSQNNMPYKQLNLFQQSLLNNLKEILEKTQHNSVAQHSAENSEIVSDRLSMQTIFNNFDKSKNYSVYFPLNNLNFILFTRQNNKFISPEQYLLAIANGKNRNNNQNSNALMHNPILASHHTMSMSQNISMYKSRHEVQYRQSPLKRIYKLSSLFPPSSQHKIQQQDNHQPLSQQRKCSTISALSSHRQQITDMPSPERKSNEQYFFKKQTNIEQLIKAVGTDQYENFIPNSPNIREDSSNSSRFKEAIQKTPKQRNNYFTEFENFH